MAVREPRCSDPAHALRREVLDLLARDGRLTAERIAAMTGADEVTVAQTIDALERSGAIRGYRAAIDWERAGVDRVVAHIDVRVSPQRETGFDAIASRIYRFPQVRSVFLMSGAYDLAVVVEGETLKDVASFVSEKLAPLPGVTSTTTHFVLKRYKEEGVILAGEEPDRRLAVSP